MAKPLIVLAGATGNLGQRVARELRLRGANLRAIVRSGTEKLRLERLTQLGVEIIEVDLRSKQNLVHACRGASCVVSTLLGLRETMIEAQSSLLEAAVEAGVPRFIPSDYCMDFTTLTPGKNRNLDLHREFRALLLKAPIRSTAIFNGAFMDLLTGEAPLVLFKINRVLYWGERPNQLMDFTTMDDTAAFTAEAALDTTTPSILKISGEQVSAKGLVKIASDVSGRNFSRLRGGSLKRLELIFKITRTLTAQSSEPFPVWQGMQYLYSMFDGSGTLTSLDNARYANLQWTGVREVLKLSV